MKWWIVGVLLVTALAYLPMLRAELVWDDPRFITEWETPKHPERWGQLFLGDSPWEHGGVYRPLRGIFYGISWFLYHGEPGGYHVQALMVYLGITLLVIGITQELVKDKRVAMTAGLLYGLHPVHVEGVAWVTASMDSVGVALMLAAYWLYLRRSNRWISLSLATAAYFTNEMTLILPLLIWVTNYFFHSKRRDYIGYIIPEIIYWGLRVGVLHIVGRGSYVFGSLTKTLVFMLGVIPQYLKLLIWPVNLTVNHNLAPGVNAFFWADHNPAQAVVLSANRVVLGLAVLLVLGLLSWWGWRKKVAWVWWWGLLSIVPVMQLVPTSVLFAERYLMIGSAGFCVGLAWLIAKMGKRLGAVVVVILALWFGYQTWRRNGDWVNNFSLWQQAIAANPTSSSSHTNLGEAYYQEKEWDKARQEYEQAIVLNPGAAINWTNLGIIDYQAGKYDLAKQVYEQALKAEPNYPQALLYLGVWYQQRGEWDKARELYQQAMAIRPGYSQAVNYLAMTEHQMGNFGLAEQEYRQAIEYQSNYADAYNNLGNLYRDMGRMDEAKASYLQALRLDPTHLFAKKNLEEVVE